MQELRLVAVSEDGTYLVLATAGRGTRFTLPVDDRLRAAVRGHFSRLGQFEIEVESPLRPKEIQARIRSGETAEEIAESAGIPVERVRWFEGPVLQEREYMAQQAQRVAVRRPGDSTPGPPLGETVEERLGRGGVDLEEVEWDSWKCEDNTWRVRLSFFEGGRPHAAEWTFDPRRRHVSPLDEIAARLTAVEWDDDALSDTVTPLVPRRPAMKVVSSDRDVPARGLPAEPEQPGAPGPLRAAEPREYLIDRGRMADPRPGFREASEAASLREAAQPRATDLPRETGAPGAGTEGRATAPAGVPRPSEPHASEAARPGGTSEPRETAQLREAAQPRSASPARDTSRTQENAQQREVAKGHETAQSHEGSRPRDTSQLREDAQSRDAVEPRDTSEPRDAEPHGAADASQASQELDESRTREAAQPRDASQARDDGQEREASDARETFQARDTAEARDAARESDLSQAGEVTEVSGAAQLGEMTDSDEAAEALGASSEQETGEVRESVREAAPADGTGEPVETAQDAEAPQAVDADEIAGEESEPDGSDTELPATAATRPEAEADGSRPDEGTEAAADSGAGAPAGPREPGEGRPAAQRQAPRPPAKKKPASRPAMPAAQDKPATGSPAAASGEPAAPQRPARRRKAKGKRASVPSWDEIMFGARRPE
ncbi:septation protein SepH [Spirillospora sp. CA-128828]|uniref:septation protein SepH n=1 Tax=Spirillospora sp. CA-128828 TaxID=3240033 RepID=UPI003D8C4096